MHNEFIPSARDGNADVCPIRDDLVLYGTPHYSIGRSDRIS